MTLQNVLGFENRAARVIAVFRAVLAIVFLASVLLDPSVSGANGHASRVLLGGYLAVSLGLMVLAWKSWWYDQRLALAMLVVDALVLLAAVFVTESAGADFTSPFLAIFALVILSATLRWDWRAAAVAGAAVIMLFLVIGLGMNALDTPFDLYRYIRRLFYMLALLMVLVWAGAQRQQPQGLTVAAPIEGPDEEALLWQVIAYARELTGAGSGLIVWNPAEEPWANVRLASPAGRRAERAGPDLLEGWDPAYAQVELFDVDRRRSLVLDGDGRARSGPPRAPEALLALAGVSEGLLLPFRAASGAGAVVLGDLPGPSADHLRLGKAIAHEVGNAFDRMAVGHLEREAAVDRTRNAIARDLHDSVAQSLAGACFRLEGLRRNLASRLGETAREADRDIVVVRDALRREQGHIRSLIESLRAPPAPSQTRDLRGDMNATLADAGVHWGLDVALDAPGPVEVPGWLSHEVRQLVREAVANAARHGAARRVTVRMGLAEGRIALHISDDGSGFDAAAQEGKPWSISERVAAIGGEFAVESRAGATRLAISLPAHSARG